MYPVFCLLGHPQAGKTTTAKIIESKTKLKRGTCSDIIYDILRKLDGLPEGDWHEVIHKEEQDAVRQRLILLGNAIGDEIPHVYFASLLNRGCRIIDGVRRKKELAALESYCSDKHIPLLKVWVTRPDRPPISDNTELSPSDGTVMLNTESLEDLEEAVDSMLNVYHKEEIKVPMVVAGYHPPPAKGYDLDRIMATRKCPICKVYGQWRQGVHFDHEMRCINDKCPGRAGELRSVVWEPEAYCTVATPKKEPE